MDEKTANKSEARWYDAYPAVKSQNVEALLPIDFLHMIQAGALPGQDFLLVDLRRNDHKVCKSRTRADSPLTVLTRAALYMAP